MKSASERFTRKMFLPFIVNHDEIGDSIENLHPVSACLFHPVNNAHFRAQWMRGWQSLRATHDLQQLRAYPDLRGTTVPPVHPTLRSCERACQSFQPSISADSSAEPFSSRRKQKILCRVSRRSAQCVTQTLEEVGINTGSVWHSAHYCRLKRFVLQLNQRGGTRLQQLSGTRGKVRENSGRWSKLLDCPGQPHQRFCPICPMLIRKMGISRCLQRDGSLRGKGASAPGRMSSSVIDCPSKRSNVPNIPEFARRKLAASQQLFNLKFADCIEVCARNRRGIVGPEASLFLKLSAQHPRELSGFHATRGAVFGSPTEREIRFIQQADKASAEPQKVRRPHNERLKKAVKFADTPKLRRYFRPVGEVRGPALSPVP